MRLDDYDRAYNQLAVIIADRQRQLMSALDGYNRAVTAAEGLHPCGAFVNLSVATKKKL